MLSVSSPALQKQQRDVLAIITGLLLFVGIFGVVMHGMPSGRVLHAQPTVDLNVGTVPPATTPPTVAVTVPPTTVPAPAKYSTSVFRAAFPVTPVRETHDLAIDGIKMQIVMYMTDQADRVFGVSYMDVPSSAGVNLDAAVKGTAAGSNGTLKSTIPTSFHGMRAVEATITLPGGTLHELVVQAPSRVFFIQGGGNGDPAKEYYDFRDSVEIL